MKSLIGIAVVCAAQLAAAEPCVAIPNGRHTVDLHSHGVNQDGESFEGQTRWDLKTERLADVNGDGILDVFVPVAPTKSACPEQISYKVFVVRGQCGRYVGTVGPGTPTLPLAATDASGFHPLTMSRRFTKRTSRVADTVNESRTFAMKAGKYVQRGATKSTSARCPHCATWFCTPAKP